MNRCIAGGLKWSQKASVSLTAADVTLTQEQQACSALEFTGTPGTARVVTLFGVDDGMVWMVYNASDSTVTLKASGETGIAVATTKRAILACDGTDVRRWTADA